MLLDRQRQEEGRTRTDLGFERERAVMLVDDRGARHRESLATAVADILGREEWIEHVFTNLDRNPASGIADRDLDAGFGVTAEERFEVAPRAFVP